MSTKTPTITAAALAAVAAPGTRVLIEVRQSGSLYPARRKTGVITARVIAVRAQLVTASGGRRSTRVYHVNTSAGLIRNLAPAETFWLAPEDAAAVKRAHAEALTEDAARTPAAPAAAPAAEITEEQPAEVTQTPAAPAAGSLDALTFAELMVLAKAHKVPGRGTARIAALREGVRAALAA